MDPVNLSLIVAFGAGALSFASPCVLPLVPAYVGHLTGRSLGKEPDSGPRSATLAHALAFVLGFSAIFIVLGASVGLVGFIVRDQLPWLRWVGGAILVVMGLHVAGVLRIPALYRELRLSFRPSRRWGSLGQAPAFAYLTGGKGAYPRPGTQSAASPELGLASVAASFLVGGIFGAGWTPCIGPILGAILLYASTTQTAWMGALLLTAYSLGLGVPFLITAFALDSAMGFLRRLNRQGQVVEWSSGALLVGMGFVVMFNLIGRLASLFPTWIV